MLDASYELYIGKFLGHWRVDKLCLNLLYHANFNFLNKKLEWDALIQEGSINQVAPKQYGSWRGGYHHALCQTPN